MLNTVEPALSPTNDLPGLGHPDPGATVLGIRAGQRMFGRYLTKRLLGRGGMGVVWLAQDEKLDREVALKFVPEMLFLDPAARDDLKRETRKSLELTHPNIVRIYDFIEDEQAAAISMEYVDGPTLSHLRVDQAAQIFEPREIEPWLRGLCEALDYAHGSARMVHRDLKPANLMLNGRGEMKITDFGIACSLMVSVNRVSVVSSSGGTLVYMSPQQMRGEMPAASDDLYALGATLYELLTGKPPFYTGDVSLQTREGTPEKMAIRRAQLGLRGGVIPAEWEEVILACLAKRPEDRPSSALEIWQRLSGVAASEFEPTMVPQRAIIFPPAPVPATQPATNPPTEAPRKERHLSIPIWAAIAAGALVLVTLSIFMGRASKGPAAIATVAPSAASVVAPVPVIERGGLMIKTAPPGATVTVGGEAAETSPATIKGLSVAAYPVKILLPGYDPVELNTNVKANEFTDLATVTLVRSKGALQLTTSPEGSDYELHPEAPLDDAEALITKTGQTPATIRDLPTGKYAVTFRHDGWPDQTRSIEVTAKASQPLEAKFALGTLEIASTPSGASVYRGEQSLGTTPLRAELPPGDYPDLTMLLDGFVPAHFTAKITGDQTTTLPASSLQPIITALQITSTPDALDFAITDAQGTTVREGKTPAELFDLPAGNYNVVLKRAGWPDFSAPAALAAKQPLTIDHEFPEGTVKVTSSPAGAEIFRGAQSLGLAPLVLLLPPGKTELTAKVNGAVLRTLTVTVSDDDETALEFSKRTTSASTVTHHRRKRPPTPPPSTISKIGTSLKTFFTGGKTTTSKSTSKAKPHR